MWGRVTNYCFVSLITIISIVDSSDVCFWSNPLFNFGCPDPWITFEEGFYYLPRIAGNEIHIHKSELLSNWNMATKKLVYTQQKKHNEMWAPELHFLNNKWYVYYAADDVTTPNQHRMWVLESETEDPFGNFILKGQIKPKEDYLAIDGTVMEFKSKLYFIWAGVADQSQPIKSVTQNLYIAEMESPTQITSTRVLIASPTFEWHKRGLAQGMAPALEAPEVLINPKGKYLLTYSTTPTDANQYTIGILALEGDNPMDPASWIHHPQPLFGEDTANSVFNTGHPSFTKSRDGKEHYMIYHAMTHPQGEGIDKLARMQKFEWDVDTGFPMFGLPVPWNKVFPAPSGECPLINRLIHGYGATV